VPRGRPSPLERYWLCTAVDGDTSDDRHATAETVPHHTDAIIAGHQQIGTAVREHRTRGVVNLDRLNRLGRLASSNRDGDETG
jgi:hypothetical protein